MRFRSLLTREIILFLALIAAISSCGIYETTGALNPPFGQQITETTLKFTGDNSEDSVCTRELRIFPQYQKMKTRR